MKVKNTNDFPLSVGVPRPENTRKDYAFMAGDTIEVEEIDREFFKNIDGVSIDGEEQKSQTSALLDRLVEKPQGFVCEACGKVLKNEFGYNGHMKTHTK